MSGKSQDRNGYLFDCGINFEPVLISACLLGIPCRWHGHKPKKRDKLIERLKKRYVLLIVFIVSLKKQKKFLNRENCLYL